MKRALVAVAFVSSLIAYALPVVGSAPTAEPASVRVVGFRGLSPKVADRLQGFAVCRAKSADGARITARFRIDRGGTPHDVRTWSDREVTPAVLECFARRVHATSWPPLGAQGDVEVDFAITST